MMDHGRNGALCLKMMLLKGDGSVTGKVLKTIVTYLKMDSPPSEHLQPPSNLKVSLMRLENPPIGFYRYLYKTVGENYDWIDRQLMSDEVLQEEITSKGVDIYVAYVGGVPAGFFELDSRTKGQVWLALFGIAPQFQGMGLGKWLLSETIATAWLSKPESVRLETCTLDSPRALPLYQKMGFAPYDRKEKETEVPGFLSGC